MRCPPDVAAQIGLAVRDIAGLLRRANVELFVASLCQPAAASMRRVMIIGQPGAGKSTLARQIGALTGLPVVHIDHIHWTSGWVERPREEKTRLCGEVHARKSWIFEGGIPSPGLSGCAVAIR